MDRFLLPTVLAALVLSGCGLWGGAGPTVPPTTSASAPTPTPSPSETQGQMHQYQAMERSLHFSLDADGTLHLVEQLIFDAGVDGQTDPLVANVAPIVLDVNDGVRDQITPIFSNEEATDLTDAANEVTLEISRGESWIDEGYRYLMSSSQGWSPGRHVVRFTADITDTSRTMPDGVEHLLLPHLKVGATWYPYQVPLEFTTITADLQINCMQRRGTAKVCDPDDPLTVGVVGDFPGLGDVGDEPRYYFLMPTTVGFAATTHGEANG